MKMDENLNFEDTATREECIGLFIRLATRNCAVIPQRGNPHVILSDLPATRDVKMVDQLSRYHEYYQNKRVQHSLPFEIIRTRYGKNSRVKTIVYKHNMSLQVASKIIPKILNMVFDNIVENKRLKEEIKFVDRCRRDYHEDNALSPTDGIDEGYEYKQEDTRDAEEDSNSILLSTQQQYQEHQQQDDEYPILFNEDVEDDEGMQMQMQISMGRMLGFFKGTANDYGATMWWNGVLKHLTPSERLTAGMTFCAPSKYTK